MEQRLTTIERIVAPQYATGSPVLLEACALYYDNIDGKCIAQLKLKNLDDRTINAVMIEIICFDVFQHEIGKQDFKYLSQSAKKGMSFGSRIAVPLNQRDVRSYRICLKAVSFDDGTILEPDTPFAYHPLPDTNPLEIQGDLLEQYKRELIKLGINTKVMNQTQRADGMWQCVCGSWQRDGSGCMDCHASEKKLLDASSIEYLETSLAAYRMECEIARKDSILAEAKARMTVGDVQECNHAIQLLESIPDWKDASELILACRNRIQEINERKETERRIQEQEEAKKRRQEKILSRNKTIRRVFLIVAVVVTVILFTKIIIPDYKYNMAKLLISKGEYQQALDELHDIGSYKDSQKLINQCKAIIMESALNSKFEFVSGMYLWDMEQNESLEFMSDTNKFSLSNCPQNTTYYPALRIRNISEETQPVKVSAKINKLTAQYEDSEISASQSMTFYLDDELEAGTYVITWYVNGVNVQEKKFTIEE